MPPVKWMLDPWIKEKAEELRQRYGAGTLTPGQVGVELGIKDNKERDIWLEGVKFLQRPKSSRRHYPVEEVAKRMHQYMRERLPLRPCGPPHSFARL